MFTVYRSSLLLFALVSVFAVAQPSFQLNQVGYSPLGNKRIAVSKAHGDSLYVYAPKGALAGTFALGKYASWDASQDSARWVDLSALHDTGTYALMIPGSSRTTALRITNAPETELTNGALRFFYFQRASLELLPEFAGKWARKLGHPDTLVYLHPSTGDSGTISSPRGWYDAGDYGKYMVNSGITVYTLLELYQDAPAKFAQRTLNIPESANNVPDLLDEIRWNLDWMLTMQAKDGGVYHKLTTLRFSGDIMPSADSAQRFAIGKTSTATFDFAAAMAKASVVYKPYDLIFSTRCLAAAFRAYQWGIANPDVKYQQPDDVSTGQYGDQNTQDERFWASVELYIATQGRNPDYLRNAESSQQRIQTPSWSTVQALGYFSAASNAKLFGSLGTRALEEVQGLAEQLRENANGNPYGITLSYDDHIWGSNAVLANQSMVLLVANRLHPDSSLVRIAHNNLDYLLGMNPLAMSYVTGFGTKNPLHPHHRPSQADTVLAPIPAMLVGGPHDGGQDVKAPGSDDPWKCPEYRVKDAPARCYLDNRCSYATNEVAINWNAPLVYLTGMLE